ncbi:hypothetical protein EUGRSUZ_B03941 [Eucalyptus grandis]|uniref:Uncharacterized protein n=3 Tax=Eucalyptus grandis TaxID=71139 RepID=A0ACC3LYR9_EUCGR|nr:hypothetical protein EUGRSUZ_B03941 [Eucalyptus grandis]
MGRAPCCDKANVKRGPWSPEEDAKLRDYIEKNGTGGNWIALPQKADLKRCGKSCRLRWLNYLRPNIKHGEFSIEEDRVICTLYATIGSRWSIIAAQLPGRTDNDIKNYWNTKLKKKLMSVIPQFNQRKAPPPFPDSYQNSPLSLSSQMLPPLSLDSSSQYYACGLNKQFASHEFASLPQYLSTNDNNSLGNPNNCSSFQAPEGYYSPLKESNNFMFGGEGSCSCSDGSSGGQIGQTREIIKQEEMGFQDYSIYSDYAYQCVEKTNGYFGENIAESYDLEDVKKLMGSTSLSCNGSILDENKEELKLMPMYYF